MRTTFIYRILFIALSITLSSCGREFLEEDVYDFYSPDNAFTNTSEFVAGVTGLHQYVRDNFYLYGDASTEYIMTGIGTDLAYDGEDIIQGVMADYNTIKSTSGYASTWWNRCYDLIHRSNNIIWQAENKEDVEWDNKEDQNKIVAEAKFFRAFAYRFLADIFGGVPIIKEPVTEPKVNFVRSSRKETFQFVVEDLEYAAKYLPLNGDKDGRISKGAANHLLAEIYISLEEYDKAIRSASDVIDGGNYHLMTERFGSRKNDPGDVYWDLYREGNQNRGGGNQETIWALQMEYNTPGGGSGYSVERAWGPRYWNLHDPSGEVGMSVCDSLGRPVGWCRLTPYAAEKIWEYDPNDMRNSRYNIQRDFYYNDEKSPFFGQKVDGENLFEPNDTLLCYYPYLKKVSTDKHDDGIFDTGRIYRDIYVFRLSETYLLRAEAYMHKGNLSAAAADINSVRSRAQAKDVSPNEVNIQYILDERARELICDEYRRCTLSRLNMLCSQVKKYNIISGSSIKEHNNLLPIPQSEIDRNSGAELEQNPGY